MDSKGIHRELRDYALSFEGATEDFPWEDIAWKVGGKAFVFTGKDSASITVKSSLERQQMLILHPNIEKAAYVGRFGWVRMQVDEENLELAKELIEESFRQVAKGKKRR